MPTVDFTKDELVQDVREVVHGAVSELRSEMHEMEHRLRSEMHEMEDRITIATNSSFQEVGDQLNEIKTELRGIKRVVRQHSADIAELKAA
jgi:phage-related protein